MYPIILSHKVKRFFESLWNELRIYLCNNTILYLPPAHFERLKRTMGIRDRKVEWEIINSGQRGWPWYPMLLWASSSAIKTQVSAEHAISTTAVAMGQSPDRDIAYRFSRIDWHASEGQIATLSILHLSHEKKSNSFPTLLFSSLSLPSSIFFLLTSRFICILVLHFWQLYRHHLPFYVNLWLHVHIGCFIGFINTIWVIMCTRWE